MNISELYHIAFRLKSAFSISWKGIILTFAYQYISIEMFSFHFQVSGGPRV